MEKELLLDWARREVDLACVGEDEETKNVYEKSWRAYYDILGHIEDLEKPGFAKTIIMLLMKGSPLSPIEDNNEDWTVVEGFDPAAGNENPGWSIYQCKRRTSLFKKVTYDRKTGDVSEVKFSDTDRYLCMDVNTELLYTGGMGPAVLDEMIPVKMPYEPHGKIKIYTEEFKCHENFPGDSDTFGVLYFRMPNSQIKEVKRFFKEDHKTHEMVEIGVTEYLVRKNKSEGLKKKQINKIFDEERAIKR